MEAVLASDRDVQAYGFENKLTHSRKSPWDANRAIQISEINKFMYLRGFNVKKPLPGVSLFFTITPVAIFN